MAIHFIPTISSDVWNSHTPFRSWNWAHLTSQYNPLCEYVFAHTRTSNSIRRKLNFSRGKTGKLRYYMHIPYADKWKMRGRGTPFLNFCIYLIFNCDDHRCLISTYCKYSYFIDFGWCWKIWVILMIIFSFIIEICFINFLWNAIWKMISR